MRIPIGKTILPVRVLLMVRTMDSFTVNDAVEEFLIRHRIELTHARMKQILDDLHQDGLLIESKIAYGSKNKITTHYTFIPLPDGSDRKQQHGESTESGNSGTGGERQRKSA